MRNHLKIISIIFALLIISLPVCFAVEITPTYDANGNMQYDGDTFTVYNSLNQPYKVYNGSNSSGTLLQAYTYDSEEERMLIKHDYVKNETVYYFDKDYVRIKNATGTYDYEYVYLEGQLITQVNPDGSKLYTHNDAKGDVIAVTNQSGAVIENNSYTPSGQPLTTSKIRKGYEAKEFDSVVGDTDFNFRRYKPEWQIFKQPDTLISNLYNPQALNRYMFELGNPYKYIDPDGHVALVDDAFYAMLLYSIISAGIVYGAASIGPIIGPMTNDIHNSLKQFYEARANANTALSVYDASKKTSDFVKNPTTDSFKSASSAWLSVGVDLIIGSSISKKYGDTAGTIFDNAQISTPDYSLSLGSFFIDSLTSQINQACSINSQTSTNNPSGTSNSNGGSSSSSGNYYTGVDNGNENPYLNPGSTPEQRYKWSYG